ncbi:MAG: hypothetical protein HC828_04625 [Blastochloris sp.]|nr:hypothetical protein [Blastochloris sp.]
MEPSPAMMSVAALRGVLATSYRTLVIDVRSAAEFAAGHVPGAQHIPTDELEQRLAELPPDRPIITYCTMQHPGNSRGERAAALLRRSGFDARVLDGGLPAWMAEHQPIAGGR